MTAAEVNIPEFPHKSGRIATFYCACDAAMDTIRERHRRCGTAPERVMRCFDFQTLAQQVIFDMPPDAHSGRRDPIAALVSDLIEDAERKAAI